MSKKSACEKNITTSVENGYPKIVCRSPWSVTKVKALPGYILEVTFYDGTHGLVEMKSWVMSENAGFFAALKDIGLFNQVYIQHGAVTWPGEIDLAPDTMHDVIKKNGTYILG